MKITLLELYARNFKGLKFEHVNFDGEDMDVFAQNGGGKTTLYDAFLWLLFAKDSEGRTEFDYRPLDADGIAIKGLVVEVGATILVDGVKHVYVRKNIERITEKEIRGFSTVGFIDEVEYPPTKFTKAISDLIDEVKFRCLTDLTYFNEKLTQVDRRKLLLQIAGGEVKKPEGFERLLIAMDGRSMLDFKSVLVTRKKNCVKEQKEIPSRIDEIQRGLKQYAGETLTAEELTKQRDEKRELLTTIDDKRRKYVNSEDSRKKELVRIEGLVQKRADRRIEFETESSAIKPYLDEKASISTKISELVEITNNLKTAVSVKQTELNNAVVEGELVHKLLTNLRSEYSTISKTEDDTICFNCRKPYPPERINEMAAKKKEKLNELTKTGNELLKQEENNRVKHEAMKQELALKTAEFEQSRKDLDTYMIYKRDRFAELDKLIESRPIADPTSDEKWIEINKQIEDAREIIGLPLVDQIRNCDTKRAEVLEDINRINELLVTYDRANQDRIRITELESREKDLGQQVVEIKQLQNDIEQYQLQESKSIEESVNCKFKHTKFKLFSFDLDGGVNECCEATLHGTPYSVLSTGERIFVGFDEVNLFSIFYDLSVPIFVDHAESVTMPLESDSQIIRLFAEFGTGKLKYCKVKKIIDEKTTAKKTNKRKKDL